MELACGTGRWPKRAAIGVGFAVVDAALYLALVNLTITLGVATGPPTSPSGPGPLVFMALAAWIVPAARFWWLRRGAPPRR